MVAPSPIQHWPSYFPWGLLPLSLQEPRSLELSPSSPLSSQMKKLRPQGSKAVTEWGLESSLEGSPEGGLSGTFPRGLLGVLRIRALVRDVNLLASSVGSSCQLLLESRFPSLVGVCKSRWEGVAILSYLTFNARD